jgi:hypothetical protein
LIRPCGPLLGAQNREGGVPGEAAGATVGALIEMIAAARASLTPDSPEAPSFYLEDGVSLMSELHRTRLPRPGGAPTLDRKHRGDPTARTCPPASDDSGVAKTTCLTES